MSLNHYLVGNAVVLIGSCELVNPLDADDKTLTEPTTVTFYRNVEGAVTVYTTGDPEVTNLGVGIDACTVQVTQTTEKIMEKWRYQASGACEAAAEDEFTVIPSAVV